MVFRKRLDVRRKRRRFKKKNGPRKAFGRTGGIRVPQYKTVLPRRLFTRLTYATENKNQSVTVPTTVQFAANGLFDPDITGVGHQPMGFDQLTAIYQDYRVHAVKMTVELTTQTAAVPGLFAIGMHGNSGVPANMSEAMEDRSYKHRITEPYRPARLTMFKKISTIFGKSKLMTNGEANFSAGSGANPTTLGYCNLMMASQDETATCLYKYRVTLTYFVEFNNLRDLPAS